MIYHSLIIKICDKFGVGYDVANLIESFTIQACCSALPIKNELQKLVGFTLLHSYKLDDYRRTGYYELLSYPGFTTTARNIIGSFGFSVGKENYIDYTKKGFDYADDVSKKSIVHYFLLINKQIPQK